MCSRAERKFVERMQLNHRNTDTYLGRNENILALDDTFVDFSIYALSHVDLISIDERRIDVPISTVDGIFHRLFTVVGIGRTQSDDWNIVATVQSYGRSQHSTDAVHTKLQYELVAFKLNSPKISLNSLRFVIGSQTIDSIENLLLKTKWPQSKIALIDPNDCRVQASCRSNFPHATVTDDDDRFFFFTISNFSSPCEKLRRSVARVE